MRMDLVFIHSVVRPGLSTLRRDGHEQQQVLAPVAGIYVVSALSSPAYSFVELSLSRRLVSPS